MPHQPEFRASAKLIRHEARVKLKQLRHDRIHRKHTAMDSSNVEPAVLTGEVSNHDCPTDLQLLDRPAVVVAAPPSMEMVENTAWERPPFNMLSEALENNAANASANSELAPDVYDDFDKDPAPDDDETRALAEIDALDLLGISAAEWPADIATLNVATPSLETGANLTADNNDTGIDAAVALGSIVSSPTLDQIEVDDYVTPESCTFRSIRNESAAFEEPHVSEPAEFFAPQTSQESGQADALPLCRIEGIGPGLIWLLKGCGIENMRDLSHADPDEIGQKLGLVGQILDVSMLIQLAKSQNDAHDKQA